MLFSFSNKLFPKMALEYDEIIAIIIGQIVGTITFIMFYDKLLKARFI